MGSVSISHLIIFIASLLVAASVAGTLIVGVEQVSDSVDQQSEDMTQQIDTELTVISDPASNAIYDGDSENEGDGDPTLRLLVTMYSSTDSINPIPKSRSSPEASGGPRVQWPK